MNENIVSYNAVVQFGNALLNAQSGVRHKRNRDRVVQFAALGAAANQKFAETAYADCLRTADTGLRGAFECYAEEVAFHEQVIEYLAEEECIEDGDQPCHACGGFLCEGDCPQMTGEALEEPCYACGGFFCNCPHR